MNRRHPLHALAAAACAATMLFAPLAQAQWADTVEAAEAVDEAPLLLDDLHIPSKGLYKAPFHVKGKKILDVNGKVVSMHGVNWFGFETQDSIVHGLWARSYQDMVKQMKELGFNAVRLPFCPKTLTTPDISGGVRYDLNPDLQGKTPLQAMDRIIAEFANNGFYILLDHHRPDCNAISQMPNIPGYSLDDWVRDLMFVTTRYKDVKNVIGIDLKNEPHSDWGTGAFWGTGKVENDWKLAAERAGAAVHAANPKVLVFVEGVSDNNGSCQTPDGHWWGGNIEPIECFPIDENKIPRNKLVLSPHIYGPDVADQAYFADSAGFPNNMPRIWENQMGRFMSTYPVVLGEFGGKFMGKDQVWQTHFVDWLKCKNTKNFFYWSWNPNSGDTGGILKDDWISVNTEKYQNLKRLWDGSPVDRDICATSGLNAE
jgi:endoglucanase